MQNLFVLDITRGYLPTVLLTAAAYAADDGDALLVQGGAEHAVVEEVVRRFSPARVYAMPGTAGRLALGGGGDDEIPVEPLPAESASLLAWLMGEVVETARGVVLFPVHSPSWAIKAAALAARLGYLAWPLEEAGGFAYAAPPSIPILVVGEAPGALNDKLQGREYRHLPGDRAVAQYLMDQGRAVNYAVLINSADLEPPTYADGSMKTAWTQGLSLLAPLLASYRDAWVADARTPRPDSREIERTLNQKAADSGLAPDYLAIVGTPGAIPFIHDSQLSFQGGEDSLRDIHLRLNQDLFFDCAEGRLFGQTVGKVSLQILSTKRFAKLRGNFRKRALVASRPHVESNVNFAIDEAVGRTQITPLLTRAGVTVTELYDQDCSPARIAEHLPGTGFMLYGGHGSPEALSTHEAPLYAEFLPKQIAPAVVYACACSTMYPGPNRISSDGGYSFADEPTPFADQIGPAFVDRGALAFVGGLTTEDVLLNTPMYVAFMQALFLKGQSVGQAVRTARNHTLTHMALLAQRAPETYAAYRGGLANAVQQQVLLGDPAFAPYPGTKAARLPLKREESGESTALTVSLPDEAWVRQSVAVTKSKANKEFHRARQLEAWLPVGEDVFNWGENYTVAKDSSDESDKGVMGSYLHLTADLPVGRVPVGLTLEALETATPECLLCGHSGESPDVVAKFNKYVVPFRGSEPPVTHDQTKGWAFVTEETPGGLRVHWFVPALVVDDATRQAVPLRKVSFRLQHRPGTRVHGQVEIAHSTGVGGAPGALEGSRGLLTDDLLLSFGRVEPPKEGTKERKPDLAVCAQVLSGPGGRWSCWLPKDEPLGLRVGLPVPVFRHVPGACLSFTPDTVTEFRTDGAPVLTTVNVPDMGILRGTVVDTYTGKPLAGAQVRLWRGKNGGKHPVYEGFVAEAKADAQGRFEFSVSVGSYLLGAAHRGELRYFAGKAAATVYKGRESAVLVGMEPGAVLTGTVRYVGPYTPKHTGIKLLEHGKEETVIGGGRVGRDGQFEVLVPVTKPFDLQIWPEGFARYLDDNEGSGYHLVPGETLSREITIREE